MPTAHQGEVKYAYLDHDTDMVNENPPILNQWYTVFDAEDIRLIWCIIMQGNDESANKDVEVRWTIDGNVYFVAGSLPAGIDNFVHRDYVQSSGGTSGLVVLVTTVNAAYYVDKRGHSFKVEIRITEALGTNQSLQCLCVRETLEQT